MKNETARREIESLDYYLQNHTDDYSEESHTAMMMGIKALEQEPCEDCISRQAVLDMVEDITDQFGNKHRVVTEGVISLLPPVTPQSKTGHWEWVQYDYNPKIGNWHCSECRSVVIECVDKNDKGGIPLYKYCPQCGAKMVEPQERSE